MRRVTVEVKVQLPKTLTKDLLDNEAVCDTCGGLGWIIRANACTGREDNERVRHDGFAYRNDSLFSPCPDCCNGVVEVCKHCGQPIKKYNNYCGCVGSKAERICKTIATREAIWENASKITYREAIERFNVLYIDDCGEFVDAQALPDVINDCAKRKVNPLIIKHVYGTKTRKISCDADNIIDDACEDLHEEAADTIGRLARDAMQSFLDRWADTYGAGTLTYEADFDVAVIVGDGQFVHE